MSSARTLVVLIIALLAGCGEGRFDKAEPGEELSGGAATLIKRSKDDALAREALSQPAPNLSLAQRGLFAVGNSFFTAAWVPAPASTEGRDGLGPLFNAAACQSCHIRDGRGRAPRGDEPPLSLIARLGPAPDTVYGRQLQDFAVPGYAAKAQLRITWEESELRFSDGEAQKLRRPRLLLSAMAVPLDAATRVSLRIAPPMIGLGLLEAVPESELLALADPQDRDADGISGRVNRIDGALGRFGWKATQPSVRAQAAAAFLFDMGLTSTLQPQEDCSAAQVQCRNAPHGGLPEVSDPVLDAVDFYARHLAVPARRWVDTPEVLAGKKIFYESGCVACHSPRLRTAADAEPQLADQLIRPYTDLLLHDLGEGLADEVSEHEASGREWRTPPLWGLHLAAHVAGGASYLHDGRARSLMEAVLWHGGEAQAARERVLALPKTGRENLVWFLKSL